MITEPIEKTDNIFFGFIDDGDLSEYSQYQSINEELVHLEYGDRRSKRQALDKLYKDALIKKSIDIPVDDGLSGWRDIHDKALSEEDTRLKIKNYFIKASKLARQYGEVLIAPVLINTESNGKITKIPFSYSLDRIFENPQYKNLSVLRLLIIDDFEKDDTLEKDVLSESYGEPKWYFINDRKIKISPSRIIHLKANDACHSFIESIIHYFDHFVTRNNEVTRAVTESNWIILKTNFKRIHEEISARLALVHDNSLGVIKSRDLLKKKVEEGLKNRLVNMRANANNANAYAIDKEFEEIDQIDKRNIKDMTESSEKALELMAAVSDVPMVRYLGKRVSGMGAEGDSKHYIQFLHGLRAKIVNEPLEKLDIFLQKIYPKIKSVEYTWNDLAIEELAATTSTRTSDQKAANGTPNP